MVSRWLGCALRVLLLAFMVGCARSVSLPPVPASMPTLTGPVPVVFVDSLTDGEGNAIMGGYSPPRRTIYISTVVTDRVARWMVAFHERCHHDMVAVGLHNIIDPKVAQAVCDWIALRETRALLARYP